MEYKSISDNWLNSATEDDLNKIVICYNDGQGDHSVYTIERVKDWYKEINEYQEDERFNDVNAKLSYIIDLFYNVGYPTINGNSCDALIFDNGKYYMIHWDI
jgi:hypothetical protein